jgi:GntR family transcriptional regulator
MSFNDKTLNKNIPVPLHYQLRELLLSMIKSGKYKENDIIPTEMELVELLKISRPTVRQAINDLVNEGYLYRVKAKGTFVARQKMNLQYTQIIESFDNEIERKGLIPNTKVLELIVEEASPEVADKLGIEVNSKVTKLRRLRFANEEPILVVTTYVPFNVYPELIKFNFENKLLYKAFEEKDLKIKKVTRTFEAIKASAIDAKLLNMKKGDPIHCFETIALSTDDRLIEYSICNYRGDRNKFIVEITNNS